MQTFLENIIKFTFEKYYKVGVKYYDISYEFYLHMLNITAKYYLKRLKCNDIDNLQIQISTYCWGLMRYTDITREELTRLTNKEVSDLIYFLTIRDYEKIKKNKSLKFLILCERIVNVKYSKYSNRYKYLQYKSEQKKFEQNLYVKGEFEIMWNDLNKLFN